MKKIHAIILSLLMIISIVNVPYLGTKAQGNYQLSGSAHVQTFGDKKGTFDGETLVLGTTGQSKRLEEITLNFQNNTGYEGSIQYRVHRQTYGWTDWINAGQKAGTRGQGKRLEGIQIRLTGELAKHYSVKYRVHIQTYGWNQGWQYDGALAGTEAEAKRLESLEVKLVPKTEEMGVVYRVHRQTYGWEKTYVTNGTVSGTTGQGKRLEGIELALTGNKYTGSINYRTHVQSYGWMDYVSDGMMSGTSGKAKRLEAIQIYLSGEIANYYDVYYRVHAQSYGWLSWARNGEMAGTEGLAKRLEAIQIVLVKKGTRSPGGELNGINQTSAYCFVGKTISNIGHTNELVPDVNNNSSQEQGNNVDTNKTQGNTTDTGVSGDIDAETREVLYKYKVENYTYEIYPLFPESDNYFYVKTDNPYPLLVSFMDENSKYYTGSEFGGKHRGLIKLCPYRFDDVQYENYTTGRVHGGYIFYKYYSDSIIDGGELTVYQGLHYLEEYEYLHKYEKSGSVALQRTDMSVNCQELMPIAQYLVNAYYDENKSKHENLSYISKQVNMKSLYPKRVYDITKPNADRMYPNLASSIYYEHSLNDFYDIYEQSDGLLMLRAYPYTLDSIGMPGLLKSVAKIIDPNCTVENGIYHYYVDVAFDGEKETYGGAGKGTADPLYACDIEKNFKFDGSVSDFALKATYDDMYSKYKYYQNLASDKISQWESALKGEEYFAKLEAGKWIQVINPRKKGPEYGKAYVINAFGLSYCTNVENAWVDGRYVNIYNEYQYGVKFGDIIQDGDRTYDTSKSDIILNDVEFKNKNGDILKRNMMYHYDSGNDIWKIYNPSKWTGLSVTPANFTLTRTEVMELVQKGVIDGKTNIIPEAEYIYDGTAYPGTPCNTIK